MILIIVDNNLQEYKYQFNIEQFTFCLSWVDVIPNSNYILTITNKTEISLEQKIQIFNLFEQIKNLKIKNISIIKDNDTKDILFDNILYDLFYDKIEYTNEYGVSGINSIADSVDQNKLIFTFNKVGV